MHTILTKDSPASKPFYKPEAKPASRMVNIALRSGSQADCSSPPRNEYGQRGSGYERPGGRSLVGIALRIPRFTYQFLLTTK